MPKLIKQTWFSSQAKRKGEKATEEPLFPCNSIASLKSQPVKNYFCLSFSCLSKEFTAMSQHCFMSWLSYMEAQQNLYDVLTNAGMLHYALLHYSPKHRKTRLGKRYSEVVF